MPEIDDHEVIRDLLGVYAIDATDSEEAARVEAHVAGCDECRAELDDLHAVAGQLGTGEDEVPPAVWDRIAAQITVEPPLELDTMRAAHRSSGDRRLLRLAVAAVVILVVGIVSLAYMAVDQRGQIDKANKQLVALQEGPSVRDAADRAATQPGAQQIALRSGTGSVAFLVVVTKDGTAYVIPEGSTTLSGDHTYQLWGVHGSEAISLGLLGAKPEIARFAMPSGMSALAVTVEQDPGVVTSHNKPVAQATI